MFAKVDCAWKTFFTLTNCRRLEIYGEKIDGSKQMLIQKVFRIKLGNSRSNLERLIKDETPSKRTLLAVAFDLK